MTSLLGGLAAAVAAAALVAAGRLGTTATAAVVAVLVGLIALGWGAVFALPGRVSGSVLVGLAGWGAEAGVLLLGRRGGEQLTTRPSGPLAVFAAAIAAATLLAFVRELLRRDGRHHLVESITGTLAGAVLAVLAAGWVLLPQLPRGRSCVVITALVAAAAAVGEGLVGVAPVAALRRPLVAAIVGAVLAVGIGAVASRMLQPGMASAVAAVAVAVAVVVAGMGVLFAEPAPGGRRSTAALGLVAVSAARIAAAGTVAYALLRLVTPS